MDEKELRSAVDGMSSGRIRHPRFTKQEVQASNGREHDTLWTTILSLEPAGVHAGGGRTLTQIQRQTACRDGSPIGTFKCMAMRYESDPKELMTQGHKYFDAGIESRVYRSADGFAVKVRRISAYNIGGVIDELAKLVYHNYLFPKDAYTLADIAVWNNNGYDEFYLVLEQPFVTPLTDADGIIILPTDAQIVAALGKTPERFSIHDESADSSPDSGAAEMGKFMAYNGQYVVYDFQPGRNTFIDAATGEVRFIDPRVWLNDPGAGFSVSRFGRRTPHGFVRAPSDDPYADYDGDEAG